MHNVQIVPAGSTISVTTPTSTDYVIFNYWMVNGEQIDLSTYTFSDSTKVIANVTYKYDVKFMTDDETTHNSQIVTSGSYATLPEAPTMAGYEFDGWSIDGVTIIDNIATTPVTGNVTYKAVFTKLHTVTFVAEGETKSTQSIRNGEYATDIDIEDTTYKVFNGWTLNGALVDISTQKIVADTTFIASFTYKYDVKFMNGQTEVSSQIITSGSYAILPASPTKEGYTFKGWSLTDGGEIVNNIESFAVTQNVTYYAVFEINSFVVSFIVEGQPYGESQTINYGSYVSVPTSPTKEYFVFEGWSLTENGEIVSNIDTTAVTQTTTYYAVFEATMNGIFVCNSDNFSYILRVENNEIVNEFDLPFGLKITETNKRDDGSYYIYRNMGVASFQYELSYNSSNDSWVLVGSLSDSGTWVLDRLEDFYTVNFVIDNDELNVHMTYATAYFVDNTLIGAPDFSEFDLVSGTGYIPTPMFNYYSYDNTATGKITDLSTLDISEDTTIYIVIQRNQNAD